MLRLRLILLTITRAVGVLALAAAARTAEGQGPVVSAFCAPGIPQCSQVRFSIFVPTPYAFTNFFLAINPVSGMRFVPIIPGGTIGIYEAQDAFGPFGGLTTLDVARITLGIDFSASGAPFTLGAGGTGFFDVAADLRGDPGPNGLTFAATDEMGAQFSGGVTTPNITTIPEPETLIFVAAGIAMLGVGTIRRRRCKLGARNTTCTVATRNRGSADEKE